MTKVSEEAPVETTARRPTSFRQAVRASEIDLRMLAMVIAFGAIIVGFGVVTNGRFLQPVNLINLAVQAVSIAILATGMTLIIVSRNIDLSVGSIVGLVGMTLALLMARILPDYLGFGHPLLWIVALVIGLALGALIGAVQGFIVAYVGVPSFVVTLGGLLAFRGLTWVTTRGVTIAPVDPTFRKLGGGPLGSIGATASWVLAVIASAGIIAWLVSRRRQRRKFGFPLRPMWAEILVGGAGVAFVLGIVQIANRYFWPASLAARYAEAEGIEVPEGGLRIAAGIPWPVIVLVAVTIAMTFIATRLRFGRYVFAIGGNPEAAELGGINTRWTIMKTFILMGLLAAISASIAVARIDGGTLDLGQGYELYVIAAAVIGGTSFVGGIGTIPGSVLGALVMASLAYGLSFVGLSSPIQDIVAGGVLVIAVALDSIYRRRQAR